MLRIKISKERKQKFVICVREISYALESYSKICN